jgi:hypothetical protein
MIGSIRSLNTTTPVRNPVRLNFEHAREELFDSLAPSVSLEQIYRPQQLEKASPEPVAEKPAGFDQKFDSFVRGFAPVSALIHPDGSKALLCLENFGPPSDDHSYLSQSAFWVDLKEGRADQLYECSSSLGKVEYLGGARVEGSMLTDGEGKSAEMRRLDQAESQKLMNELKYFVGMPKISEPQYVARVADDQVLLVTGDKYDFDYDTCKAYLGKPGAMEEVEIESFMRLRDGGTTHIRTAAGEFYSPSPLSQGEVPHFRGQSVTMLSNEDPLVAGLGIDFGAEDLKTPTL